MREKNASSNTEGPSSNGRYTQSASVTLEEGMRFSGEAGGHRIDLDVPVEYGEGAQPMQLLLLALAGCTAMDVLSILRKKRQPVTGLRVEAAGQQAEGHPRVFERVEVLYRVRGEGVDPEAVGRAVELSRDRYCPVIATVRPTAEVVTRYEVEEGAAVADGVSPPEVGG
jgi:putative redox protein